MSLFVNRLISAVKYVPFGTLQESAVYQELTSTSLLFPEGTMAEKTLTGNDCSKVRADYVSV